MQKTKKYEERLMDVLHYDDDDLEANRAGRMTQRQIKRLNQDRILLMLLWLIPALLGVGALSLSCMVVFAVSTQHMDTLLFLLIIGFGVIIWLTLYFGAKSKRLVADLREQRVEEVEGRIDLSLQYGRNNIAYAVQVDDERFALKKPVFFAFKNGDPYRIYYAPHSKRILSVEWLRDDDNLL